MINRNMPELLFVEILPFDIDSYPDGDVVTYTGSTHSEIVKNPVEYVRADLVTGDDDQPMEDGQTRWIKPNKTDGWVTATVEVLDSESDRFMFSTAGEYDTLWFGASELYKIGPVIHPPVG